MRKPEDGYLIVETCSLVTTLSIYAALDCLLQYIIAPVSCLDLMENLIHAEAKLNTLIIMQR
jgi:hypothetical protein